MWNFALHFQISLPRNVPYDWIIKHKSNQHWLRKEAEKFYFPGGGTMFPNGVSAYVDLMVNLIPGMKDGTVRKIIDLATKKPSRARIYDVSSNWLDGWKTTTESWTFGIKSGKNPVSSVLGSRQSSAYGIR